MPVNPVVLRVDNVVLFSPNFWGDRFLTYTYDDAVSEQKILLSYNTTKLLVFPL